MDRDGLADFVFDDQPEPMRRLFHYTSATALAAILDESAFRFTPLAKLNDPRESRDWQFGMSQLRGQPSFPDNPDQWMFDFNRRVRDPVQIACFTAEDPGVPDDATYLRGFSRARNWAQYGENHRGACLIFDRQVFVDTTRELAAEDGGTIHAERVDYVDQQVHMTEGGQFLPLQTVDAVDIERTGAEWLERHWRTLFFRKNLDWASEREFRIVAVGAREPLRVPISRSLVAIALGFGCPPTELSVLESRLRRDDRFPSVVVGRMQWTNGAPGVTPAPGALTWRYRNWREPLE